MREMTLNINALPEAVFQLVKTDTVTLRESADGVISLFPAQENTKQAMNDIELKSRLEWLERLDKAIDLAQDEDFPFLQRSKEMRGPHGLTDD